MSAALVVVHGPGEERRAFAVVDAGTDRRDVLTACAARLRGERIEAEPMTCSEDASGWVVEYTVDS